MFLILSSNLHKNDIEQLLFEICENLIEVKGDKALKFQEQISTGRKKKELFKILENISIYHFMVDLL